MSGGGSSGSSGTSTTVQKADPWSGLQPFLGDLYNRANLQVQNPVQFHPGQTYASASPETLTAQNLQEARALSGSPITGAMQGELTKTLGGDYLGGPGFQAAFQPAANAVTEAVNSTFGGAGRFGSGAHANALSSALTDEAGKLYGDERTRQMQAMLFAPQAANQDYYDAAKLAEVGANREGYSQQALDDANARFQFAQTEPWQRLQQYNQILNGGLSLNGGTSTTTGTQPRSSLGAGLLGGAAAGAGMGSAFGPMGMAGGGLLGGLLGAFG